MMKTTRSKPARSASKIAYSGSHSPFGPTGVVCFGPPKREPAPAAITTNDADIRGLSYRSIDLLKNRSIQDTEASLNPAQTPSRLRPTCPTTFQTACPVWPSRKSASVSKLNDENVVKPPRRPTMRNVRASDDSVRRLETTRPATIPIRTDP